MATSSIETVMKTKNITVLQSVPLTRIKIDRLIVLTCPHCEREVEFLQSDIQDQLAN